ncbi:MAG: substrate-binding domain-containing protein, partial [Chloroflexia bacterium]
RLKDKDVDAVLVDSVRGAYEAVSHLIKNGYRRIGIVSGPSTVTTGRDRLEGYRQALQDASIVLDPALERTGTFRVESGRELAGQLLDARIGVDALFTCNNLLTLGAWEALQARQLAVPNDIGMVGYDDMQWAEFSSISLTTVMQPVHELGITAAARLFQRLQSANIQSRQEIVLAPNLRVRGSSQPRSTVLQTLTAGA